MKLALLSDVHSNLHALDACLAHACAAGATDYALLGDLVGYGGDPCAVVDRVMQLAAAGAAVVQGNHDQMAVQPPVSPSQLGQASAHWTHAQLDATQRAFLAALPLVVQRQHYLLVHASADQPDSWRYVEDAQSARRSLLTAQARWPGVRCVLGGHVHEQMLYYQGLGAGLMAFSPTAGVPIPMPRQRSWLATVGSVGQPRDGNARAMYALLDLTVDRLCFHRVSYDVAAAVAAIRRAGFDGFAASRLEEGR